jgi:eukaryotic-like serine/threonine-protein kinase
LQRFQREAKTACQINHPNVVSTHDFGMTEDGNLYLVMDFIEGGSLDDLIRSSGALAEERAVPIFIQICDALQFAHDIGVLHRDLKPSNVMLTKQGTRSDWVKLVDFGLAKFVSDDTGNGAEVGSSTLSELGGFIGSPLYVSPEHIQGQKLDRRSDIYSWGCLAYMTVTGKNAMSGANVIDIVLKQLNQIPAPFKEAAPKLAVNEKLEAIIMKAMQKDPANRHASFNELKAELQGL